MKYVYLQLHIIIFISIIVSIQHVYCSIYLIIYIAEGIILICPRSDLSDECLRKCFIIYEDYYFTIKYE